MLGLAAFMAGWFKVNRNGDNTTIEINRAEIRNDTRKAIEKGREVLERHEGSDAAEYLAPDSYGQPGYPPPSYDYGNQQSRQPALQFPTR